MVYIFSPLLKTGTSLEVPNVTLRQTESFESKQGGPQTKILIQLPDIFKDWVEEKTIVDIEKQCFFEVVQVLIA